MLTWYIYQYFSCQHGYNFVVDKFYIFHFEIHRFEIEIFEIFKRVMDADIFQN
jgi:hypothetical protein